MLLIELMISLAISVTLLVAIAAAFGASSAAVESNAHFFTATQAGRVSMNQILSIIRRCDSCQPGNYDNTSTTWSSSSLGINYHDPGTTVAHTLTYQYAASPTNELQLAQGGTTYSLAKNVTAMTFTADLQPDPQSQSHALRPVRITVDMTMTVGKETVRLTGSAVPRNTVVYK
jgi:hypothetical protein